MMSSVIGGAMLPHAPQFFTMPETEDRNTVERVKAAAAEIGPIASAAPRSMDQSSPTTMWSSSFTLPHRPLPHFGAAPEELLKELVAKALFNKGVRLGELGRTEDEIAVYEDLVARFGIAPQLPLRERVASAKQGNQARSN